MAIKRSLGKRSRGRKSRGRNRRGGSLNDYSSAASYGMSVVGDTQTQTNNTFGQKTDSNAIIGTSGQKAGSRKKGSRKSRKGGFWGNVINNAVVPFGILAMQQSYKRNKKAGRRTKRRH